ncbi:MAG: cyclase family protein [Chloroflexota bacterium]
MSVRLIDISRSLNPTIAVWPGDTPLELQRKASLAEGDTVNLTTLVVSSHTGTHVDAPYHFLDDGPTLETVDLSVYWGPAQVVTVTKEAGALVPADFAHADLTLAPRLLVHSKASHKDPTQFHHDFVYPSPELADFLWIAGIILYGADAPSMDASDSETPPVTRRYNATGFSSWRV